MGFAVLWLGAGIGPRPYTVTSQEQRDRAGMAILGSGWADCAEVTETTAADDNLRFLFASWVQGYITGRNETGAPTDAAAGADAQGARSKVAPFRDIGANESPGALVAAALDYCAEHPLDKFSDATRSVYDRLVQSARSPR